MKKIYMFAVGVLMLAGFAAFAPTAQAAVVMNVGTAGGTSCPTVEVSTSSTVANPFCYPTHETTSAGSIINVYVYYHNGSANEAAQNVTLRLSQPNAGVSTSHVFTGSVSASNGNTATGSGNISISSSQSLTFINARWFKNQDELTPLPVSASNIFSSGINLGSIPGYGDCPVVGGVRNDFCHEGRIQLAFQVSNTTASTCSISLAATPANVSYGDSSNVTWNASQCNNFSVSGPGVSSSALSGSQSTGALNQSATYTATGYSSNGQQVTRTATVTVIPAQHCDISVGAAASSVVYNGVTSVSWSASNCNNFSITGPGISSTSITGSQSTGPLTQNATYTARGYSQNGTLVSRTATITVGSAPTCVVTSTFSANPTNVSSGGTSMLSWSTSNCTNVTVTNNTTGAVISTQSTGSVSTGPLYTTTSYTLAMAGMASQFVTVNVNQIVNNCTASMYASPSSVVSGSSTTLYWNTSGCTTATVVGPGLNSNALSNSVSIGPIYGTQTYNLTAYAADGSITTRSTTVSASTVNTLTVTTLSASNTSQNSATLNGYINASCGSTCGTYGTYYFQYGTSQYSMTSQTLIQNFSSTAGNVSASVANLLPNTTYYFQLIATNPAGTNYGGTLSFVTSGSTTGALAAVTSQATNVTATSARLNGVVYGPNSNLGSATTYFEYGTSPALGFQTTSQIVSVTSLTNYFDVVSTTANTTYYYRIVAVANGQTYPGSTVSFRTPGVATVPPTVITQVVTGTGGGSSFVSLSITNQSQIVFPGDLINYTVNYQNISNVTLSNAVLNVILPSGVTYRGSSQGVLTTNNTVAATLGTLAPRAQGTISIQASADEIIIPGNNLVTTATLAFTTPGNAQDSAIAYVLNSVGNRNNLAGLALFGGGFFPNTFFGWVLLLGLLLILILIARYFYYRANRDQMARQPVREVHYNNVPPSMGNNNGGHNGYPHDNLPH